MEAEELDNLADDYFESQSKPLVITTYDKIILKGMHKGTHKGKINGKLERILRKKYCSYPNMIEVSFNHHRNFRFILFDN
jgi:hypothetical protein